MRIKTLESALKRQDCIRLQNACVLLSTENWHGTLAQAHQRSSKLPSRHWSSLVLSRSKREKELKVGWETFFYKSPQCISHLRCSSKEMVSFCDLLHKETGSLLVCTGTSKSNNPLSDEMVCKRENTVNLHTHASQNLKIHASTLTNKTSLTQLL